METKTNHITPLTKSEIAAHEYRFNSGVNHPAIAVTTYLKHENFWITIDREEDSEFLWIDLTTFDNANDLELFCRRLHCDESNPDLLISSITSLPWHFSHERFSHDLLTELYEDYLPLSEDARNACEEYWSEIDNEVKTDEVISLLLYQGENPNDYFDELAENYFDELDSVLDRHAQLTGVKIPTNMYRYYFDWDKYREECRMCDYDVTTSCVFDLRR